MDSTLFQKTALGVNELNERGGLISQKERRLLITIDGKRDATILAALLPGEDVPGMLLKLRNLGMIAAVKETKVDPLDFAGPVTIAPKLPVSNTRQLDAARKVILDVSQQYLGQSWADRLGEQLGKVRHADEFAPIIEQWLTALRRSGHRGAADTGQRQVNALLATQEA
ncbi:hypothetical protein [Chitinilyticum piscinae]|uniref:Uncharacterized protein n=1 Tax=Chitinilyticum piscinae TaxID=2866724 RepID=A0A8J7FHT5_9NEIS|nr:hypothetical protein [Chitinilyticum piscinae]MBE9608027.1 hypothetical protein [Chitinilyticum piscinae]